MNPFTSVRPRGADAPAKLPVQRKKKAVPITQSKRVLNVGGKLQSTLAPRQKSVVIETAEQARASNERRRAISKAAV